MDSLPLRSKSVLKGLLMSQIYCGEGLFLVLSGLGSSQEKPGFPANVWVESLGVPLRLTSSLL